MTTVSKSTKKLNPQKSLAKAEQARSARKGGWTLHAKGRQFTWSNRMERVNVIRKGLPFEAIEVICKKASIPVKQLLAHLGMPQTTYNKKKRDQDLLNGRDSEMILLLFELLEFGAEVFNQEIEKFQRWLTKPNSSLGGENPESLFDSATGIQEVKNALNRLEYGNMA